jgi:hypothetical protein
VSPRSHGTRAWLDLLPDEVAPRVLESERPSRVVWSSLWPSRPDDCVVLELSEELGGTALRFTLRAAGDPPDDSKTGHIRKRMNHLLFADLRFSYGN